MSEKTAPKVVLRRVKPEDFDNGFLETMSGLSAANLTPKKAKKVLEKRDSMGIRTYVVAMKDTGYIIATASLVFQIKLFRGGGVVGMIEDVVVHPDYRGYKYGVILIEHMIQAAKRAKCYKVILWCNEKNVGYYEKFGFHSHEVLMRIDF
jgi:glucosamine-phosphate N-acetyltransferase